MFIINCVFEFYYIFGCNVVISYCFGNKLFNYFKILIKIIIYDIFLLEVRKRLCIEIVYKIISFWVKELKITNIG